MKNDKEWYIKLGGEEEGPYSFWDLKEDLRITKETLAWRKGMPAWLPIRLIPELAELFKPRTPYIPGDEGVLSLDKSSKDQQLLFALAVVLTMALLFYFFIL